MLKNVLSKYLNYQEVMGEITTAISPFLFHFKMCINYKTPRAFQEKGKKMNTYFQGTLSYICVLDNNSKIPGVSKNPKNNLIYSKNNANCNEDKN